MGERADPDDDVRRAWMTDRVERRSLDAVAGALEAAAELLAVATGDAVSLRVLSDDGRSLLPLAAHHPDPEVNAAMLEVMARSVQPADSGVWRPVVEERRPRRYEVAPGEPPAEASAQQRDFMRRFPVTAIVGAPVLDGDRVLGGASLVRYTDPRPFSDADEEMVVACAVRVAPLLVARAALLRLRVPPDPA